MSTETLRRQDEMRVTDTRSQADGYRTPTPTQKRIGEIALKELNIIANARWLEGIMRLTIEDIFTLDDAQLANEIRAAVRVMDAISEEECEQIAQRAGL